MIAKKNKTTRIPPKKLLQAIATELDEIIGYFEGEGFSRKALEEPSPKPPEKRDDGEGDAQEYYNLEDGCEAPPRTFDREDIEVAIDVFTSNLVHEGLIRAKSDEAISFTEVFERVFGEGDEITGMAKDFEEHIEGYFDIVAYVDMRLAFEQALEIQSRVLKRAGN